MTKEARIPDDACREGATTTSWVCMGLGIRASDSVIQLALGFLTIVIALLPSCLHAQTTEPSESYGSDIRFHRVFAPSEIILQADDYLPMDRQEFHETIEKINRRSQFPRHPFIQAAEYASRYVAGELVGGTATWNIVVPDKAAAIMSLEQMNLAIESARWLDSAEPAQLGNSDKGAILVVPADVASKGAGTLRLHWTLTGTSEAIDTVELDLELQSSLATKFEISTSESILIAADQGLVQPPTITPGDEEAGVNGMEGQRTDVWRVDLGGIHRFKLVVTPQRASLPRSLVVFHQDTDYSISLAGNEIDSRIQIHKSDQPLRRIHLAAKANIQIRNIRWNDALLPWRSTPLRDLDKQLVTVIVPPTLSPHEDDDVLRITATAPTKLDVLTPLPSLLPQNMLWQGGTTSVTVAESLRLQNYELTHARQIGKRNSTEPTLTVQNDSPQASISLRVAARTSKLRIANGVTAIISSDSISTESVVELRQYPAIWFRLVAEVASDWTIDDVSSVQTDLISDWEIRNHDGQRLLEIQLQPPPQSTMVPRLRIRAARKLNDQVASLTQSDVTPFRFHDAEYEVDLRSFRSTGGVRLELLERDISGEVSAQSLSDASQDLVDVLTGDLVYSLIQQRTEPRILLRQAESQFVADCDVLLRVGDARCSEEFVIEWTPQDSRLDQVLVHLSEARNDALQWSFVDPTARNLVPRRLALDEQQRAGLGSSGETWLFLMPDLGTAPRTIRGYRDFRPTDEARIVPSLVMVPDARNQRAVVTLENNSATQYEIEITDGIEATLVQPGRATSLHSTMGSYRYRPERHAVGAANAIQLMRVAEPDSSQDKPNCWAWNASLDSHFSPDGTAQHRFTYRLENHGRRWIEIRPTEKLKIRRIAVGSSVVIPDDDLSDSIRVELPQKKSDIVMLIDASTERSPWRMGNKLHVEFARVDIPVLHAQWTVWLPEDYRPLLLGQRLRRESQPWTQQLFGRFGRQARRLGLWSVMLRLNDAARLNPNRTIEGLYSVLEQQAEHHFEFGHPVTWGQVLAAAANELPMTTILVDQAALAEEGISPITSLDYAPAEDSISDLLQAAGIVVLQDAKRLILTTNRKRGLYADDFAATIWPDIFHLRQGPLANQVNDPWRFPNATAWHSSAHLPATSLWGTVPRMPLVSERHLDAWHVAVNHDATEDVIGGDVLVLKTQISQVLGWLGFLLSLAVSWRAQRWVPCVAGVVLTIGVILAIAIPAVQPAAWGMLAGLPVGLLIRQLQVSRSSRRAAEIPSSDSTVVRSTYRPYSGLSLPVGILILVLTFSLVAVAQPASTVQRNPSATPGSHRVLVPIDEKQELEGETLFLPKDFYHQLLKLEADGSGPATIMRSAKYRARLVNAPDRQDGPLELEDLMATYEIETQQLNAMTRIPLDPDLLDLGHGAIKLDGRAVQPIWMPVVERKDDQQRAAKAVFVRVALPGTHRLELRLRTSEVIDVPGSRIRMDIPRMHRSTLTVEAPRKVDLTVPSSLGICQRLENGQLICQLGPTDHLTVVWPALNDHEQMDETSARLLNLLDMRRNQAFLNTQIQVEPHSVAAGSPITVDVTFDETMQWLPNAISGVRIIEDPNPAKRRLRIVLNSTGRIELPLRFLLQSPAASREVRLPKVSLEGVNVIEQWLGVSLEEGLLADYPQGAESLAPAVFQDAWGQDSAVVNAAFQVHTGDDPWAANVHPIEVETVSDETLELHVGGREPSVRYQAQISVTGRDKHKHQLRTRQELKVTEVEVLQNAQRVFATWSQTDDAVFVFLGKPLAGEYTLMLNGSLPTAASSERDIPLIWLTDAKTTNLNVRLFRAPNTQLHVIDHRGFQLSEESASLDESNQSWRVADLQTNRPADARATIEWIDARPSIAGQQVTTVLRDESGWTATVALKCEVIAGTVDHLTVDVPQAWRETLSVSPSLSHQIVDVGGGHRQLRIWLPKPVVSSAELTIRGVLETSEGITVPELRPLNIEPLESYVRIPSATRNEQFTWSTSRLLAAAVPEEFAAPADDIEFTNYRSARRFRAELLATKPRENLPHVGLSEVHHVVGKYVDYGVVTFQLEPSGLPTTVLTMPLGSVLLDASVGGVSAQRTQISDNQWRISLGATRLPHRLRVAYQLRHAPRRDGTWNLQSPTLQLSANLNGRTLWTISAMDDVAQSHTVLDARSLSPVEYVIAKVYALRQLFDAPDLASMDYSDPEAMAWYAHWKNYIREHIAHARQLIGYYSSSLATSTQTAVEQALKETDDELQQVEAQLGIQSTSPSAEDLGPLAGVVVDPTALPLTTQFGTRTRHFATGLGVSTIQIRSTSIGDFDRTMRFVGAMVMVVAGVALGFGGKSADWEIWLRNRRGVLLLLLGVLWWFALYPQWFAVVIVVIGLMLKFWPVADGGGDIAE